MRLGAPRDLYQQFGARDGSSAQSVALADRRFDPAAHRHELRENVRICRFPCVSERSDVVGRLVSVVGSRANAG
jgi:hypothetical protein